MPQDTTLYREITLDLQHHNFPDVLAVENDSLRGWLITPLNNGALMDVTGFTPSLWSIATTQEIPQPSTGEVTADGKLAIPIPAGMLVPGTRTVQQVKLSKAGVGDIRFPAFSLIVGDALDNLGGSAGGDTGVWQELMDRIQAATALTEQLRNEAAVSAAQADEDRTAAEQAAVQAQTCQEQACQCAANAEASKTAAANSESAALASRNAAASSASAAAGSASNALASVNAANASAVAAQLSESNVEAIEQSLQDTVTQAEEATAAANQAVQGVQNILSGALATQSSDGLMSQEDKEKLDGIEPGANNYTHPASHPISMIEDLQEALDAKQNETDLSLITQAKTITGAINETAQNMNLLLSCEYGSNSNGEYWKFSNGLMICKFSGNVRYLVTSPYGSLHLGNFTCTFPHSFAYPPNVAVTGIMVQSGAAWPVASYPATTTRFNARYLDVVSRLETTGFGSYVAIGRWK